MCHAQLHAHFRYLQVTWHFRAFHLPIPSFCCESNISFIEKLQQYKASSYDDVYIRLDTMILIPIPIFSLKRSAETSIQGE